MKKEKNELEVDKDSCADSNCPEHGNLKVRGWTFKGYIIKKFPRRIVIEFDRTVYVRKYERYMKKKTKIHARLPRCKENEVNIGDYVLVGECRPLSKITHFVYLRKVKEKASDLQTNRIAVAREERK